MKILLTYSSLTGNTRSVAEAIAAALEHDVTLAPMAEAPDYHGFDLVIAGFWIDKGKPNAEARRYLKTVQGARTAFFFTLGADVDSEHAKKCIANSKQCLEGNEIPGHFHCLGKIDPKLIKKLKMLPSWFPHGPNPERIARWERAATHPDANDLAQAAEYFRKLCAR